MQRAPQFLVREDRGYRSVGDALAALWEAGPAVQSLGLCDTSVCSRPCQPVAAFFASSLFHFSIIFFLLRLPLALFSSQPRDVWKAEEHHRGQIVYALHAVDVASYFPLLKPKGPGGRPGRGLRPALLPPRGGTAFHSNLTIISNPPHPDNARQTIIQMSSPPELKIPVELQLPNILVAGVAPAPPARKILPHATPARIAGSNAEAPPAAALPSLPVTPSLVLPAPANPLPNPSLTVPPPAPPSPAAGSSKGVETPSGAQAGVPGGTPPVTGLLSLSVNPAPAADSVVLPPGNRLGAFSVSPEGGGKEGSPGGLSGGNQQGGAGGKGAGGDMSTGIGIAREGGGGGTGSVSPGEAVSINGSENGGKDDLRPSFFASTLVYPVKPPPPRRNPVVVTAGPAGGGGLQVYGVLKGGRIYTVYLPMPGKSWVLQFCARGDSGGSQQRPSHGIEVRLEPGIVPPSAEEQFDFHRPPLSRSSMNGKDMIVLHGVIREDGSVGELKVLQGLLEVVDQAAVAAFSRWKFRPALRSDRPIAVEVLVGIPMSLPAKQQ